MPTQFFSRTGQQTFSVRGQGGHILSSVGHAASVTATQLCHGGVKAATDGAEVSVAVLP